MKWNWKFWLLPLFGIALLLETTYICIQNPHCWQCDFPLRTDSHFVGVPFHYDNIYQNLIMCQITNNLIEPPWMLFNLLHFLTAVIVVIAGCRILVENDYLVFMQLCLPNNTPDILIQIKTKSFKWMVLKQHMVCRFSL